MAQTIDPPLFNFNIWEELDEETMSFTETSEFWSEWHIEASTMDLPPLDFLEPLNDSDEDWSLFQTPEDPPKENIVHHDCMWASSSWKETSSPTNTFVPAEHNIPLPQSRSLLKREMSPTRPDTPPSLDGDEPPQFRHAVDVAGTALRLLRNSAVVAADHSYTLARQHIDYLGVQTPSDSGESEEEIDVVSLGQPFQNNQNLRMELVQALPPQERPVEQAVMMVSPPRPVARKRLVPPPSIVSTGIRRRGRGPGRRGRRSNTESDSEADSPEVERRSIHNDMERQRRIGLKNLFDELKKQIPATRDKERAPKVVILREAATLCRKLSQDDIEREKLRKKHNQLMTRLKKLRTTLAARYRPY